MSSAIELFIHEKPEKEGLITFNTASGQKKNEFVLPWMDTQEWNVIYLSLEAFQQYEETWIKIPEEIELASSRGLVRQDGRPHPERVGFLGQELYEVVFGNTGFESAFQKELRSHRSDVPIIKLHYDSDSRYIPTYPWEILHDKDDFLFDSLRASLVRCIDFNAPLEPLELSDKLNILFLSPRPQLPPEYVALPLVEQKALTNLFSPTPPFLNVLEPRANNAAEITFSTMVETLNHKYRDIHVVHIDGHGDYGRLCEDCNILNPAGETMCQACESPLPSNHLAQGYVAFANNDCTTKWVSGRDLGKVLANRGIVLVLLSACSSGLGSGGAFNSVAGALVKQGIPAVVAMQFSVEAESTRTFVSNFYDVLLTHDRSVAEALAAAKTSLLHISDAWYRPVLFLRTDCRNSDGRILLKSASISTANIKTSSLRNVYNRKARGTNLGSSRSVASTFSQEKTDIAHLLDRVIEFKTDLTLNPTPKTTLDTICAEMEVLMDRILKNLDEADPDMKGAIQLNVREVQRCYRNAQSELVKILLANDHITELNVEALTSLILSLKQVKFSLGKARSSRPSNIY